MIDENFDYGALTEREDGETPTAFVKSNKVYKPDEEYITIRLSDFVESVITEHDYDDGRPPQRGIFIPFKINDLLVTSKKNVLVTFKKSLAQVASSKYTHIITQVLSRDAIEERRNKGFNSQQIVGHARPCNFKKK